MCTFFWRSENGSWRWEGVRGLKDGKVAVPESVCKHTSSLWPREENSLAGFKYIPNCWSSVKLIGMGEVKWQNDSFQVIKTVHIYYHILLLKPPWTGRSEPIKYFIYIFFFILHFYQYNFFITNISPTLHFINIHDFLFVWDSTQTLIFLTWNIPGSIQKEPVKWTQCTKIHHNSKMEFFFLCIW